MVYALGLLACTASPAAVTPRAIVPAPDDPPTYLLVRTDDAGMSHSVNTAIERLIQSGLPVSVSVMFPTPWHQETVEMLRRYPETSVGIHLTLNSEWKRYRWGPVLGRSAVPSLVDSAGYFFPASADLRNNDPDLGEVERELRAQIERALRSGLRIDYVDYHMGTAVMSPEFRAITERLARQYGLGMSGWFGERVQSPQYAALPPHKIDSLTAMIARLEPGVAVVVTHVGIDNEELGVLVDMNTSYPLPDMSRHRQAELDALTSPRFRALLVARNIRPITYRQLIAMKGLATMQSPFPPDSTSAR